MIINLKVLGQLNLVNVGSSPDIKFINFKSAKGCVLVQGQELTALDSPCTLPQTVALFLADLTFLRGTEVDLLFTDPLVLNLANKHWKVNFEGPPHQP